jgi:hypothetical protein
MIRSKTAQQVLRALIRTRIIMIRSLRALLVPQTPFKDKEKNDKKSDSTTGTTDSF